MFLNIPHFKTEEEFLAWVDWVRHNDLTTNEINAMMLMVEEIEGTLDTRELRDDCEF